MTRNYFCVRHKSRRTRNQHFKLLYFKLNSHFGKSNYISACRKLNLLLINSICLVVSFLEMQRKLIQSKVHYKFFSSVSKETTHKPSKVAAAKTFRQCVHVIDTTCFDGCFLFHLITGSYCFLQRFAIVWRFFQPPYCNFHWNKCFERSPYFTLSPQ